MGLRAARLAVVLPVLSFLLQVESSQVRTLERHGEQVSWVVVLLGLLLE